MSAPTRRLILGVPAVAALALGAGDGFAAKAGSTQSIEFAAWQLSLPADWTRSQSWMRPGSQIEGGMWMASAERTRRLSLQAYEYKISRDPPQMRAAIAQSMAKKAATDGAEHLWRVMGERARNEGAAVRSELDLLNKTNGVRVLNVVLATDRDVVELCLHDNHCVDYSKSAAFFAPIAASLHRR
jgi:hypothetical protein